MIRDICLGDAVDSAAERWGDSIGWVFDDLRVSFREMRTRAETTARALMASGIGKGDVVAIWTSNRPEFAYCLMGCAKIGAILVAINTRSRVFEVEHVLRDSGAKVLLRLDLFLKMDFRTIFREACAEDAIAADGTVLSGKFPHLREVVGLPGASEPGSRTWSEFLARGQSTSIESLHVAQNRLRWDEPVVLQYTSGTTARPKGALCNHRYACNFGVETVRRLKIGAGERVLNTQPFYHNGGAFGAVCVPLSTGHCSVMPEYYEAERVLSLIQRERCVARTGFGAMYVMEMDHPRFRDYDLSSLRAGWCIATPEVIKRAQSQMGLPALLQIYGATEGGGTAGHVDDPEDKRIHSCGRAVEGVELRIANPATGGSLPAGAAGEILLRGWWQMNGYLNQPAATAAVLDPDGWLHTGDRGYLDDEGYLFFLGRIKNMLKVGGENVAAEEVEAMLLQHPKVKMALVIGAPDRRLQEVVMAIIELQPGESATEQEFIDFCAKRMANFRVPKFVKFIAEWPLTGSGKIERHIVKERFLNT
jgi:acyl-CoA synthetase (AMP-forming)/AMP-acid ligase II